MGEFLQTRGALDGSTLRRRKKDAKHSESVDSMPVQVTGTCILKESRVLKNS